MTGTVIHRLRPSLEVKLGLLKNRIITKKEIEELSKVSSLLALQSQVAGGLKSPIFGLVFGLKQIINKLVWALGQIKDKQKK